MTSGGRMHRLLGSALQRARLLGTQFFYRFGMCVCDFSLSTHLLNPLSLVTAQHTKFVSFLCPRLSSHHSCFPLSPVITRRRTNTSLASPYASSIPSSPQTTSQATLHNMTYGIFGRVTPRFE